MEPAVKVANNGMFFKSISHSKSWTRVEMQIHPSLPFSEFASKTFPEPSFRSTSQSTVEPPLCMNHPLKHQHLWRKLSPNGASPFIFVIHSKTCDIPRNDDITTKIFNGLWTHTINLCVPKLPHQQGRLQPRALQAWFIYPSKIRNKDKRNMFFSWAQIWKLPLFCANLT